MRAVVETGSIPESTFDAVIEERMTNEQPAPTLEAVLTDAPPNLPDVDSVPADVLADVPVIEELV